MAGEMGHKAIPIGIDNFRKIRDENYYFVDKSELISDILADKAEVYLFTRPRRFGKSLNLSMLDAFFNLKYKGNSWFDGLMISEHKEAETERNASPVIYLNMKDIQVRGYGQFLSKIRHMVYLAYLQFPDLNENHNIPQIIRRDYLEISPNDFDEVKLQDSIKMLCMMIEQAYGLKPVVLIDEYDNPINNAYGKDDYEDIVSFLRNFYSATFKSNEHLKFAVITGVMQIAKETIFSGLNNLKTDNIFTDRFDERYGFTASEVRELCTYYGHSERYEEAKEWYDGYRFGNADIYNPWSILNYISQGFKPAPYWAGTSGNDIIDTLLAQANLETYSELQTLAEGRSVKKTLSTRISLNDLGKERNAVFSTMAVAGYLNATPLGDDDYSLSIPNTEMRKVFSSMMLSSIHSDASLAFRYFFEGMVETNTDMMKEGLDAILFSNIPFILLTDEKDYQLIIASAAMCLLGKYSVRLEKESGNGRADIIMVPNHPGNPNIILELKRTRSSKTEAMRKSADQAICQIKARKYHTGMRGKTILYGVCFHGKDSFIATEELDL